MTLTTIDPNPIASQASEYAARTMLAIPPAPVGEGVPYHPKDIAQDLGIAWLAGYNAALASMREWQRERRQAG